jgi:hypothetical protein
MKFLHSARWLLLALVIMLIPVSSHAGVFISVGIAPPELPVYVQPDCPEPGLMWMPGYWAYGDDGYYWVPGAWVPAPYQGALWTPGYWGWSDGFYVFHPGYWGRHVGYYGGVNYGYGYGGFGFAGGEWRGRVFAYNTAVMHVDRRYIHNTFDDRGRVDRGFVARDSHVAFSGGPGGIRYQPRPEERLAERDHHIAATSFQQQHQAAARSDRGSYVKNNGGHPRTLAVPRPLGTNPNAAPSGDRGKSGHENGNAPTRSQGVGVGAKPQGSGAGAGPQGSGAGTGSHGLGAGTGVHGSGAGTGSHGLGAGTGVHGSGVNAGPQGSGAGAGREGALNYNAPKSNTGNAVGQPRTMGGSSPRGNTTVKSFGGPQGTTHTTPPAHTESQPRSQGQQFQPHSQGQQIQQHSQGQQIQPRSQGQQHEAPASHSAPKDKDEHKH